MKSFFFIPASKLNKLPKILDLGNQEIIVDFEDAITDEQRIQLKDSVFGGSKNSGLIEKIKHYLGAEYLIIILEIEDLIKCFEI